MPDGIELVTQMTLLYFASSFVLFLVFLILYSAHSKRYIKYWTIYWGMVAFSYLMVFLGLRFDRLIFYGLNALALILAGFYFHQGTMSFVHNLHQRAWTLVKLILFPVVVFAFFLPFPTLVHEIMLFTTVGGFILLSGILFITTRNVYVKVVGAITVVVGIINIAFPLIHHHDWFSSWGYTVAGMFGFAMALGTIGLHLDRLRQAQKKIETKLYYLSYHDSLTGLKNRAYLDKYIVETDKESTLPLSIIMADLNELKVMNDTHGHRHGDEMLIQTAKHMADMVGDDGVAARFGGDEFVIVLPNKPLEEAENIAEGILKSCQETVIKDIAISLAIGVACKTDSEEAFLDVLSRAETKMYAKKPVYQPRTRTIKD